MFGLLSKAQSPAQGYASCSGCSLCLLVCPVWRRTSDLSLTPHGRAKALQQGIPPDELKDSAFICTLCGACEPVCPEEIGLVPLTLALRGGMLPDNPPTSLGVKPKMRSGNKRATLLVPGIALAAQPELLNRVAGLCADPCAILAEDDGIDLVSILESGKKPDPTRVSAFLESLAVATDIVVADGLLYRQLCDWLPGWRFHTLGETLLRNPRVRMRLTKDDFYVIDPQAYHANYQRLAGIYDALRRETGCRMNLDLQRIAIPLSNGDDRDASQILWALHGGESNRIVVESIGDKVRLEKATGLRAIHLAELVADGES